MNQKKLTEKILIVYNPNSGKGRGGKFANRLEKALIKKGVQGIERYCSSSLKLITEFCEKNSGNPNDYSLIVIVGGDGTVGPWVNEMVRNNFIVPVYAFGKGTANDFPCYMKTHRSARKSAKIICADPKVINVDVLKVNNEQYAINVAGGGAFTNGVTRYSKRAKLLLGKLAYMIQGTIEAARMKPQAMKFIVDGEEIYESVYFFLILNSVNAGSIKRISPKALVDDGELDLFAFKKCGFFKRLGAGMSIFLGRSHKSKRIISRKGKVIEAHVVGEACSNFVATDIDGNASGEFPLKVEVVENKLPVVTNRKLK